MHGASGVGEPGASERGVLVIDRLGRVLVGCRVAHAATALYPRRLIRCGVCWEERPAMRRCKRHAAPFAAIRRRIAMACGGG